MSFLEALTPSQQQVLRDIGRCREVAAGGVLFVEGDGATQVVVILSGLVKLTKSSMDGREVVLELRGSGELIGELAAVDGAPRSATGTAIESCQVLIVPRDRFMDFVEADAAVASLLLRTVVGRVRSSSERMLEASTADALTKVCRRLVELARDEPPDLTGCIQLKSPISQQELADWAGVSRDAVVRSLTTLRGLGWLETGRQRFVISDLEALRARAFE